MAADADWAEQETKKKAKSKQEGGSMQERRRSWRREGKWVRWERV